MIKVSICYPCVPDATFGPGGTFDLEYYIKKHYPLCMEKFGDALKGWSVDKGVSGFTVGEPPTYLIIGHVWFESLEAFRAAFAVAGEALLADIPNYTKIAPTIQINEVIADHAPMA
jgi:uncharacterized protein (TIGR02118 family)